MGAGGSMSAIRIRSTNGFDQETQACTAPATCKPVGNSYECIVPPDGGQADAGFDGAR